MVLKRKRRKQSKMKRSGKWYRNNEEKVMRLLGLNPTKNSGKEEANET